jgi:hypothetical protein
MEISTIKALIKVSMNISNDFKVPMFQVLEKNKVNLRKIFFLQFKYSLYSVGI